MHASESDIVEQFLAAGWRERRDGDHIAALAAFEAAAVLDQDRLGIRVELAYELRMLDRLRSAEEVLSAVLVAEPHNAEALIERGHVLRRQRDHSGAAANFQAAASLDPDNVPLRLELVRELRAVGLLDKAEEELSAALRQDGGNTDISIERAHVRRQRGDHVGAALAFAAAAAASPKNLDVRLEFARELRAAGRLDEAETVLCALLEAQPDLVGALVEKAYLSRQRGDRAVATAHFEKAAGSIARDDPDHVSLLVELAREYASAGRIGAARETLDRSLRLAPHDFASTMAAAELALGSGAYESALKLSEDAMLHHPHQLAAYLVGARAAAHFDRAAAEALLQRARASFGANADIVAMQIHVLRVRKDCAGALSLVAGCKDLVHTHVGLWLEAVSLAIATGEFDTAESALAAPPDASVLLDSRACALRGQLAMARLDCEQAIEHYRQALSQDDSRPDWRAELAQCCLMQADVDGARDNLRWTRERSVHPSQHSLGPLLDEFALDASLLERMKQIGALSPNQQIDRLGEVIRQYPGNTAPALLYLLALRRAKRVATVSEATADPTADTIPKRIVQYWRQKTPPADVASLMATWRDAHPDYEYILFDAEAALNFLRTRAPPEAADAFRLAQDVPQQADILRLAYLAAEGGVFVDADDSCLAPLGEYLDASATFVGYTELLGNLGSNFLGAAKGHPTIVRALRLAVEAVVRGDHDSVWLSTGPGLLTRAFAQTLTNRECDWGDPQTVILEPQTLHRKVGVHCPANYKRVRGGSRPPSDGVDGRGSHAHRY